MIKINGMNVNKEHFLDGSQRLTKLDLVKKLCKSDTLFFDMQYENDEDLVTLYFLVNHMRANCFVGHYILHMHYIPSARMDRVKSNTEVFTLKWTCKMINDMGFDKVYVIDPHSNVACALLDRVEIVYPVDIVNDLISKFGRNNVVLYYPDAGAYKKYHEMFDDVPACYGNKERDWQTGQILGISIQNDMNIDLTGKTILMVDDIISYGGTFYYGAKKLNEMGVGDIYAFAAHTEMSVLDREKGTLLKALEDGTVKHLYTTNSIFTGRHEKITVYIK